MIFLLMAQDGTIYGTELPGILSDAGSYGFRSTGRSYRRLESSTFLSANLPTCSAETPLYREGIKMVKRN